MAYELKPMAYYRKLVKGSSGRLFGAAWRQYRAWLNGAIDDPKCDQDVLDWLEQIISAKVNNPRSQFYIYG